MPNDHAVYHSQAFTDWFRQSPGNVLWRSKLNQNRLNPMDPTTVGNGRKKRSIPCSVICFAALGAIAGVLVLWSTTFNVRDRQGAGIIAALIGIIFLYNRNIQQRDMDKRKASWLERADQCDESLTTGVSRSERRSVEIHDADEPLGESFCEFCPANGGRCAVCGHVHDTPAEAPSEFVNVPGRFR